MTEQHVMTYQAGLRIDGITDQPFWFCRCGGWRFRAVPMPRRKTGNNRREAELSFQTHRDAQPGAYGAGPGYN